MRRSARESLDRIYEGFEILKRYQDKGEVVTDDVHETQAVLHVMATVAVAEALVEIGEALQWRNDRP
jgi:hypothetical protein